MIAFQVTGNVGNIGRLYDLQEEHSLLCVQMVVYENFVFLKFSGNFLSKALQKNVPVDNHNKNIYLPVRTECSSCRVL